MNLAIKLPALLLPAIGSSSTSKRVLIEQQLAVVGALRLALEAMSAASPNARDYLPSEHQAARHAWIERQALVVWLRHDIEKYAVDIDELT